MLFGNLAQWTGVRPCRALAYRTFDLALFPLTVSNRRSRSRDGRVGRGTPVTLPANQPDASSRFLPTPREKTCASSPLGAASACHSIHP